MPIVLKSGILNLLEPSGPVQACNGIALPFLLCIIKYIRIQAFLSKGPLKSEGKLESVVKWSEVKWSEVKWSEVKWSEV